jgi:hypothetical protein
MRVLLVVFVLACTCAPARAQRVLLFERLTESKSERLYEGDILRYKLEGEKYWREGYIREMRPDIQALIINDGFVMLDDIAVVDRGNTIATPAGLGLITFGIGWSTFALIGYNTDGDPETQYDGFDASVSATSVGLGYLVWKLLGTRRFRTGKYKRLRIVDTSF